jgi:hypothetical protein
MHSSWNLSMQQRWCMLDAIAWVLDVCIFKCMN